MNNMQPPELELTPCDRAQETIFSLLEAEPVSAAEQRALDLHLAECANCKAYQATMENLSLSMMDLEEIPAPVALEELIMARIASEQRSVAIIHKGFQWKKYGSIAAAVLVLAVAIPVVLQNRTSDKATNQTVAMRTGTTDEMIVEQANPKRTQPDAIPNKNEEGAKPQTKGGKEQRDQLVESAPESNAKVDGAQLAFAGSIGNQLQHTYASETESDVYYDPVSTLVGF